MATQTLAFWTLECSSSDMVSRTSLKAASLRIITSTYLGRRGELVSSRSRLRVLLAEFSNSSRISSGAVTYEKQKVRASSAKRRLAMIMSSPQIWLGPRMIRPLRPTIPLLTRMMMERGWEG